MMICNCAHMVKFFSALPDGTTLQYEISNSGFSNDFLHMYYCDFLKIMYSYGSVFSCSNR